MKREKLSYFVLLAEVVVIIYLHSTKAPSTSLPQPDRQVAGSKQPVPEKAVITHHAVYTGR